MKPLSIFKKANAGIGLVEVMMAAALMGGLAMVTAKLNTEMSKTAKGAEANFEYQSLHSDIRAWLTNEDAANATFAGKDLTSCNGSLTTAAPAACQIDSINYPSGSSSTIKWDAGTYSTAGTSGKNNGFVTANLIEIDSAWLSNYVKNSAATTAGLPGTGEVVLNIRYENLGYKTRANGLQYRVKQIPIRVTVDGADVATGALASTGSGSSQWLDLANMTGIYYAAGGVQIGSSGEVYDGPSLILGTNNKTYAINSGAMGNGNYVSGASSFAIGHGNTASAATGSSGSGGPLASIAIGRSNTASGSESTAIGYGNTATDRFSMALGTASQSLGYASITLGVWALATGQNSVATGYFSESNGYASNSFGSYTKANGDGSMTLGDSSTSVFLVNNTANSLAARFVKGYSFYTDPASSPTRGAFITEGGNFVVGGSNLTTDTASGTSAVNSFTSGSSNKITGNSSAAIGSSNTVWGSASTALGSGNIIGGGPSVANGWAALAVGQGNNVTGDKSIAIGWDNVVSGHNSFVLGAKSISTAHYSLALGTAASALHPGALVLSGYYPGYPNVTSSAVSYTAQYQNGATLTANNQYGCTSSSSCSIGGDDSFTARFAGGYRLYTDAPNASVPSVGVFLGPSATAWGSISDKTKKDHFEEIDGEELLEKISGLPILKWRYIGSKVPHMGPMAQDFYQAFRLGDGNDKVITTQDIEGVTIAGVQALEKRTKELQKENEELRMRIERLESLLLQQ